MKIHFDDTALLAGIGLVPWTRLGPERWFRNYKIASLYGWDLSSVADVPEVVALADRVKPVPQLAKMNSDTLLKEPGFQTILDDDFTGYSFLTYKPVRVPAVLRNRTFLSTRPDDLTYTFENKAAFRRQFADAQVPFPPYTLIERDSVQADVASLAKLLAGREAVVVQDELLSGGRGTFVIRTVEDIAYALDTIAELGGGTQLVVSDYIAHAHERSVQCVATKYGTFVGFMQKQIIANSLLANLAVPYGDRFCGGEISAYDPMLKHYGEIRKYGTFVGDVLIKSGYRGIFSLDCLIDARDKVYVLEVNPRITGMTPLVTALYRDGKDIPFYLLHILESAGLQYDILDDSIDSNPPEGALMILHSRQSGSTRITASPASGVYDAHDMRYLHQGYRFVGTGTDQYVVQQYTPPGFTIKPGGRLVTVLASKRVTDDQDALLAGTKQDIDRLYDLISLEEVEQ